MRLLFFCLCLLVSITGAASSQAAPSPADAKLAEALFTSGKEAMARGDLATACARFSESYKLDPAVGTLLNLAACEEKSGKLAIALEHFTAAKSQLPGDDFRVPFATERVAALGKRVARVVVRVPSPPPPGARVLCDGVEVPPSSFGAPVFVDPGAHVVVFEAAGRAPQRHDFTLGEGEERVVELRAEANAPAPAPAPAAPSVPRDQASAGDSGGSRRTLALVTGGLAAAGLVTGTVTGILAVDAASTYKAHCDDGVCDAEGLEAAETGRTVRIVSPVAFGVGAAFGVASLYFFLSSQSEPRRATRLVPVASPSFGGLGLSGTF